MYNNQNGEGMFGGSQTLLTIKTNNEEYKILESVLTKDYKDQFNKFLETLLNVVKKDSGVNNYLRRKDFANVFYGYHSKNNISNSDDAIKYLEQINVYLNKFTYPNSSNFVLCGRKKFIYDEIISVINGSQVENDPLYFVLGSFEEFISNNNYINPSEENYNENKLKNEEYIKEGFVCVEEKKYIDELMGIIKGYVEDK